MLPAGPSLQQDAGIKTADTVVLTGLVQGDASTLEADTLVLSSLLQVLLAMTPSSDDGCFKREGGGLGISCTKQ